MALTKIQRAIVRDPVSIRSVLLTDADLALYKFIKSKRSAVTAPQVKEKYGITLQNAYARLSRLEVRGYTTVAQKALPTGGYCNAYKAVK